MWKSSEWRTIAVRSYRQRISGRLPDWDGDEGQIKLSRRLAEIDKLWMMTKRTVELHQSGWEVITEELQVRDR